MGSIIFWIGTGSGTMMDVCYSIVKNQGPAVILFMLISKIILLLSTTDPK